MDSGNIKQNSPPGYVTYIILCLVTMWLSVSPMISIQPWLDLAVCFSDRASWFRIVTVTLISALVAWYLFALNVWAKIKRIFKAQLYEIFVFYRFYWTLCTKTLCLVTMWLSVSPMISIQPWLDLAVCFSDKASWFRIVTVTLISAQVDWYLFALNVWGKMKRMFEASYMRYLYFTDLAERFVCKTFCSVTLWLSVSPMISMSNQVHLSYAI